MMLPEECLTTSLIRIFQAIWLLSPAGPNNQKSHHHEAHHDEPHGAPPVVSPKAEMADDEGKVEDISDSLVKSEVSFYWNLKENSLSHGHLTQATDVPKAHVRLQCSHRFISSPTLRTMLQGVKMSDDEGSYADITKDLAKAEVSPSVDHSECLNS